MKDVDLLVNGTSILSNINLFIESSQFLIILGRSGSGKTALLKILSGLIKSTKGSVLFDGFNIGTMDESSFFKMQAQSGFVFQDAALWANKSIYDNLAIPIKNLQLLRDKDLIDRRVKTALDMFSIRDNLSLRPADISAGEKKIISFLRAIMTDPDILFLDEPTTSIDKKNITRIKSIIKELKEKKKTIITVTHDFEFAKKIGDRFIIIEEGSIILEGNLDEIMQSSNKIVLNILEEIKGQV